MSEDLTAEIASSIQNFNPGALVTLFIVDCTNLGGSILRFTSTSDGNNNYIYWNGNAFTPIDFESEGWEWNAQGALPRPKIRIANTTRVASALVIEFNDLLGARVQRIRTFSRHLDNGSDPDPTAVFPIDYYVVERKSRHDKFIIEWELSCILDQTGQMLPRRQCLSDICTRSYRRYINGAFDYSKATCPYTGTDYFTKLGAVTTSPSTDKCGKRLSDCRLRFGRNGSLPSWQMPSLSRR